MNMRFDSPLFLFHWEALSPLEKIQEALKQIKAPDFFPQNSVLISLPFSFLKEMSSEEKAAFHFGLNDMLSVDSDSFTETIALNCISSLGHADFVIVGRALKRDFFHESLTSRYSKTYKALEAKLPVFYCFGESKQEAEEGKTAEVIHEQLSVLKTLPSEWLENLYFIYDTPYSLTTLSEITLKKLEEVSELCKNELRLLWGNDLLDQIKILCGLSPLHSLQPDFFDKTLFSGFYYKLVETDLSDFITHLSPLSDHLSSKKLEKKEEHSSLQEAKNEEISSTIEAENGESSLVGEKNDKVESPSLEGSKSLETQLLLTHERKLLLTHLEETFTREKGKPLE